MRLEHGHGGTQLMRRVRDESLLRLERNFEPVQCPVDRADERVDLARQSLLRQPGRHRAGTDRLGLCGGTLQRPQPNSRNQKIGAKQADDEGHPDPADVLDELFEHGIEGYLALRDRDLNPNGLGSVGAMQSEAIKLRAVAAPIGEKEVALVCFVNRRQRAGDSRRACEQHAVLADNGELSFALLKTVGKKVGKLQGPSFGGAAQELADDAGVVLQGPIPECGVGRHEAFVDQQARRRRRQQRDRHEAHDQADPDRLGTGLGRRWVGSRHGVTLGLA